LTGKWEMDGNAVNLRDGLEITMWLGNTLWCHQTWLENHLLL
jgi:hypothetical protein